MKQLTSSLAVLILLATTACSSDFSNQTYKKGPKTESEHGLIATDMSFEESTEILSQNPQASVRVLVPNFAYEFRGVSKEQILELAPSVSVEKNKFIKSNAFSESNISTSEKISSFFAANPDEEFSTENCLVNRRLFTPNILNQNLSSTQNSAPKIGDSVRFSIEKSENQAITAWLIISPNGSLVSPELKAGDSVDFKTDMAGLFTAVLFFKKSGQCNTSSLSFFVNNNSPFKKELSAQNEKELEFLAEQNFYHLAKTKTKEAKKLLVDQDLTKVVIAVLDSGVNYNHPTLKRKMWINEKEIAGDNIDNDSNGYVDDVVGYDFSSNDGFPMDENGHGTHVAGLAAGEVFGTGSENIQIMALKGTSTEKGLDLGSIIAGIDYAINNGADIINMSFGGTNGSEAIEKMIERADKAGVLAVVASGNGNDVGEGMDNDKTPQYPASYTSKNILTIAATRADDHLTRYSNFGVESVDLAAVGGFRDRSVGPLAGMLFSAHIPNPKGFLIQPMSGTSMATPVVAGVAGLLLSKSPDLTPREVIKTLMTTGQKTSRLSGLIKSEALVDAEAAVLSLIN